MTDLIDRQAAIDALRAMDSRYLENERVIYKTDAVEAISMLPSTQPEIIRCKDCKWRKELHDSFDGTPYWMCKNWDAEIDTDGFCFEAERRAGEQDE